MSWKEDTARIITRIASGTARGPRTRQEKRHDDRQGAKQRDRQARARARTAWRNRPRRPAAPTPPKKSKARDWIRCPECGHLCTPVGFVRNHHCPKGVPA